MKMLANVKLSEHKYKTPEGYLICKDSIIARTGSQTYLASEIFEDGADDYIEINRSEKEVFDPKTMASFENKPLTIEHPAESVNPSNFKNLAVGTVTNVHKGDFEGQPVMYADIVVWDQEAINLIESGEMVELSCGYDCDITDGPNPEQINIRGNHVALCEQGRAGIARIQDSKKWGIKPVNDSVGRGTLIQEFGKQGKQYKIAKINGNVIYATELTTGKNVLFKKDEENIEWAIIKKSEIRDSKIKDEKMLSFKEWLHEYYPDAEKDWYDGNLTDRDVNEIIYERKQYVLEHNNFGDSKKRKPLNWEDSFAPLFIISLDENTWLDPEDKPTNDQSKARRFETYQDADRHQKVYCKGKICKIQDKKIQDFNPELEKENINKLLNEIPHKDPKESWGSLTIDFENRKDLKKAGKILNRFYDIELFEEEIPYIAIYDKLEKEREIQHDSLKTIEHKIPSKYDSYSRKFYIKAIKALNDKLEKLEKNELLDSNQEDYEKQKNHMRNILKEQIATYEEKLNGDKRD